jgi:hypothetical protein
MTLIAGKKKCIPANSGATSANNGWQTGVDRVVCLFVVVCEAAPDFETATQLADRVVCGDVKWLEPEILDSLRQWRNEIKGGARLYWRSIRNFADDANIHIHGHFQGIPGEPDAASARFAIRVALHHYPSAAAILLIRDTDNQPSRVHGLNQARQAHGDQPPIVIGAAKTKRECWHLAGFEPLDEDETALLMAERKGLGHCPCEQSHELTASHETDPRSAKRVLRVLTNGEYDRQRTCISETSLDKLKQRGSGNGLAEFLNEVSNKLSPLIKK